MDRRQLIAVLLATLLVVANVSVWFLLRQPPTRLTDTRDTLRDQRTSQWQAMPAAPLDEVTSTLTLMLASSDPSEQSPNADGFAPPVSFRTISLAEKTDLIEAIGGAVSAIAANEPHKLITYMANRGLEPDARLLSDRPQQADKEAPTAKTSPSKQLAALGKLRGIDPHWGNWVPEATRIHVWKPRSMRYVSMVQLGQTESWLWGKEIMQTSSFRARPTFRQAIRREPTLLADVCILIEFDASLEQERSPYFFRFWYSKEATKWQPLALKLVRTKSETPDRTPKILF